MVACCRKKKKRKTEKPRQQKVNISPKEPENVVIALDYLQNNTFPDGPIALDCEMVGVGPDLKSALARISIVSYSGAVLYDVISQPDERITDYRTQWSGIRASDMRRAIPFQSVKEQVQQIVANRLVVGHTIRADFEVLNFAHPRSLTRDIASCPYVKRRAGIKGRGPVSLRYLAYALLGRSIQRGEHNSIEDAQATMAIYRVVEKEWNSAPKHRVTKRRNDTVNTLNAMPPASLSNKEVSDFALLSGDKYWITVNENKS